MLEYWKVKWSCMLSCDVDGFQGELMMAFPKKDWEISQARKTVKAPLRSTSRFLAPSYFAVACSTHVFFDGKGKSSKGRRLHVLDGAMKFLKSMWVLLRQNQQIKPCPNGTSHLTNNSGKCWSISDASCCGMMQRDASQAAKGKNHRKLFSIPV